MRTLLAAVVAALLLPATALRGRPKARYRIRVTARTSRGRTIRLDRRARTCTPAHSHG
jgi:hypothetical protein